jgi:hypothetical protein
MESSVERGAGDGNRLSRCRNAVRPALKKYNPPIPDPQLPSKIEDGKKPRFVPLALAVTAVW